jgi:uncharacterized membrane protein (UPF0127 family)
MDFDDFYIAKIGDHTFILEDCKDFPKGLSEREHLLENEGMLFKFNDPGHRSFHMKGCLIPLDIIFIKGGKIQKIYHNCNPCELNECERFEHEDADTVVELMGGTCKKNRINEGLIYRLM